MSLPESLPLARYQFSFNITHAFTTPDYAGSMLRGAFGHALKNICCITKQDSCKQCTLYRKCLYPSIFESPPQQHKLQKFSQIPNPYIIEPPKIEHKHYKITDKFKFNMVLTGIALKELALIILAWKRAFEKGVTKQKGKAALIDVKLLTAENKQIVVYKDNETIKPHNNYLALPKEKHLSAFLH